MATYTSNYAWTKPSGGDPVDIEVLNDNLDDQDSIVHQAFLDLAPVFSTANTYAVKDVVLYDNKVWICHTAVTTAGAWTGSTNWTQTTVGETGGVAKYADLPDKPSVNGNELSGDKTGAQLGLQDTLTFDNVPTANSTNPVKSGGVYSADEAIRQWTTAEAKSVSGNPITLTDGSARKAEGLVVTLEPKQSGSGTPSPTNVRPITGYTECVVDDTGKNLLDAVNHVRETASHNITSTANADGSISISGTVDSTWAYVTDVVNVDWESGTYTFSIVTALSHNIYLELTYDDNTMQNLIIDSGNRLATITTAKKIKSYAVVISALVNGTQYNETYYLQVEKNATATEWKPYQLHTATITFGQTVYGGSVDFKTGKVTVTHVSIASYNGETINEPWLSSIDEYVSGTTPTTGAQVVYPLTTPTELTLTPTELELLKGYNYITTNGTTIALDYLPNSLLAEAENYVDAKIPPAPSSDGTYVLTCTVTDGTPAYTWESAT